ncbi:putative DNA-binding transcriptional regulator AlpA [Arthrobacter sp. GAS37]|uniref:helix-turn-helix transcriptional regulator n=1 Tax=Arthrobacter sp. GAS37 TaxID=3156261 RepID=UPI003839715C
MAQSSEGLIGAAEFAEALGVKVASLYAYRSRDPRFPASVEVGMMSYWTPEAAAEYVEYRKSLRRGRPKGSRNKVRSQDGGVVGDDLS